MTETTTEPMNDSILAAKLYRVYAGRKDDCASVYVLATNVKSAADKADCLWPDFKMNYKSVRIDLVALQGDETAADVTRLLL